MIVVLPLVVGGAPEEGRRGYCSHRGQQARIPYTPGRAQAGHVCQERGQSLP